MKHGIATLRGRFVGPAAFGRLCVETDIRAVMMDRVEPAAFGRLCVETILDAGEISDDYQPPSGGCVLKPLCCYRYKCTTKPAAFGRLCVETCRW